MNTLISGILGKLREMGAADDATLLLIGSAARGRSLPRSDMDLFLITPQRLPRWRVPVELHLHRESRSGFLAKLADGDDFAAWALRYGKVVSDPSNWWLVVTADESLYVWPDWREKANHARLRASTARQMLEAEDADAAEEEYLMAVSHIARALLLRRGVFPLSRPEMPGQLGAINEPGVAGLLQALLDGVGDPEDLARIAAVVEAQIGRLSDVAEKPMIVADHPRRAPGSPTGNMQHDDRSDSGKNPRDRAQRS